MFQSYELIKYLGYNEKTKEYSWEYKIVDSDGWEELGVARGVAGRGRGRGSGSRARVAVGVEVAVINTYEKRNLPVAKNLLKSLQWYSKKYGWSFQETIEYNKKYNPKYAKYADEIEKYLLLI